MSLPWIKEYDGRLLRNVTITAKIDGVCGISDGTSWTSRAGKPLYNLPPNHPPGEYEIFLGDWSRSVSACRSHDGPRILIEHLFSLRPIDARLVLVRDVDVDALTAPKWMLYANQQGYEGVVFHTPTLGFKLKPVKTLDVLVTAWQPGTGKHEGRMGALITPYGKVGTGFSDAERDRFTPAFIIGKIIEVQFMELTDDQQFRHPRFMRVREDKPL